VNENMNEKFMIVAELAVLRR